MKNFLLILVITITVTFGISAQNNDVQRVEGGVFAAMTVPLDNYHDYRNLIGCGFGFEMRYNIPQTALDCGVMMDFNSSRHHYNLPNYIATFNDSKDSWGIVAVGDYNFRQGKKINPFAGLGIGVGFCASHGEVSIDAKGPTALFVPRIGVEIFHHIRLTASCHLLRKGFNTFDIRIGFALGGRPK